MILCQDNRISGNTIPSATSYVWAETVLAIGVDDLGSVPGRGRTFGFRRVHTDYEVQVFSSQRVTEVIPPRGRTTETWTSLLWNASCCVSFSKIQFWAVARLIIKKNYKRHYSVNICFYLLSVATLNVSAHFLGHLQAYMNINLASELRH